MNSAHRELEAYIEVMRRNGKSDATVQNNTGYCNSYLLFCSENGGGDLEGITPESVSAFAGHLWRKSFTDSTITSVVGGALTWCRWLEDHGKIKPATSFKSIRASALLADLKSKSPLRRGPV